MQAFPILLLGLAGAALGEGCANPTLTEQHCGTCTQTDDVWTCTECKPGLYLNNVSASQLGPCVSAGACQGATQEAKLDQDGTVITPAVCQSNPCFIDGCKSCKTVSGSLTCMVCAEGLILDHRKHTAGQCTSVEDCTGLGKVDGNACVDKECSALDHCTLCNEEDESQCAECSDGYSIDSGICKQNDCSQVEKCTVCGPSKDSGKLECLKCNSEYFLDKREGGNTGTCISRDACSGTAKLDGGSCVDKACASLEHCAACSSTDESLCSTCAPGWYLLEAENRCVDADECTAQDRKKPGESGYCRTIYEISTEDDLFNIGGHRNDTCVLTADIKLTKPWEPTSFWGEIDGQGHWIRNIFFDTQKFFSSSRVYISLFSNITVLKNIGLEAAVDIENTVSEVSNFYLGLVSDATERPLIVHDVVVNGSISVKNESEGIGRARIGGLFGEQYGMDTILGPNITSYCDLTCKATYCYVGGLAGTLYATVIGAAIYSNSVTVTADSVYFGGIAADSSSQLIKESFAEIGNIVVVSTSGNYIGGFSGNHYLGTLQDCYSTVGSISVTTGKQLNSGTYVSPFIGSVDRSEFLLIERCYGWSKGALEIVGGGDVYVGGLIGYAPLNDLTISSSFAIAEDLKVADFDGVNIGGLTGYCVSPAIDNSWTRLKVTSVPPEGSVAIGGICGTLKKYSNTKALTNISVDITLPSEVANLQGKAIGAFGGVMENASVTGVLVEYHCIAEEGEECNIISLIATGFFVDISGVYVVEDGGEVVPGVETGSLVITTGEYGSTSYLGLEGWNFYDKAYPTLSSLPVVDRSGTNWFVNPTASEWLRDTWAVPSMQENNPQLVNNQKCRQVQGNALCLTCDDGPCTQCDDEASAFAEGSLCLFSCQEEFNEDEEFRTCVSEDCSAGCEICDEQLTCLKCETGFLLDGRASGDKTTCLAEENCTGVSEPEGNACVDKQCAAAEHCTVCSSVDKGECISCDPGYTPSQYGLSCDKNRCDAHNNCELCDPRGACITCKAGYILDQRKDGIAGACVLESDCIGNSLTRTEGDACVDKVCAGIDDCTSCESDEFRCATCVSGLLVDQRAKAATPGRCIQEGTCSGDLVKVSSGKCVDKACSTIQHCTTCAADETQCKSCASGYHLVGNACIADDCHTRPDPVLNCETCSESVATECKTCFPGYTLNEATGGCEKNDCSSLGNCTFCEVSEESDEEAAELECIQCDEGFLIDLRESSDARGTCVPAETCIGLFGADETTGTCVDRGCGKVEHCRACEAGREDYCTQCEEGYVLGETEGVQECQEPPRSGLSGGAIAGIVIAVVVVVALAVFLCVWFLVCKKKKEGSAA